MCALVTFFFPNDNNNRLSGSSITKKGLHRGPNTRYILYNDIISKNKELRSKYT